MDALVGVWLSSVVGAAAFCAAGYVLGQGARREPEIKKVSAPPPAPDVLAKVARPEPSPTISLKPEPPPAPSPNEAATVPPKPDTHTAVTAPPAKDDAGSEELRPSTKQTAFPPPPRPPSFVDDDEVDRPTLMPTEATRAAILESAAATIPPAPRSPSLRIGSGSFDHEAHEATRALVHDALAQVEQAAEHRRLLELEKRDLERQLDLAKQDLKKEIVLRAGAEARAEELSDRLARASEESASLRHRVNMLDRQTKLLRESLKTSGGPESARRRDLEEAEEMRLKLRDVVSKLERASMPPPASSPNGPASVAPPGNANTRITLPPVSSAPRSIPGAPNMPRSLQPASDDAVILREEINRLAQENRLLRQQTLGSLPPKQPRRSDSVPDIDLDKYKAVMEQLGSVAGLRGAVLADEVGSLLIGTGELAESLAAFGAYIRDAGARTDRLLPLDGVEEVDIRDRAGVMLSTRVVLHDPLQLSLVFLASADPSFAAAKKIIEDALRLGP